jgi:hypothetical protein
MPHRSESWSYKARDIERIHLIKMRELIKVENYKTLNRIRNGGIGKEQKIQVQNRER